MFKRLDHFFSLSSRQTTIAREFIAAITTFLAMSYIVFVNPNILSEAGIPKDALMTSTIVVTIIGTLLMGLIPRVPFGVAPGMGLNAFFVYSLVIGQKIPYQQALAIVCLSGLILFILSLLNIQKKILQYLPDPIKLGSMAGIGIFLLLIGGQGLGLISANPTTMVQLNKISPTVLLGIFSVLVMIILTAKKVQGAIIIGIIGCTVVSSLLGYTHMPEHIFATPSSMAPIFFKQDFSGVLTLTCLIPLFTLIFVDLFDSLTTISANMEQVNYPNQQEQIKVTNKVLRIDSFNGAISSALGNSTTIVYLESLTGIAQGGKTGLTAIFIALFFAIALFFTPLIGIVPPYASAGALVVVGIQMLSVIKRFNYSDFCSLSTACITMLMIPFTYNISFGVIFGFLSFLVLETTIGNFRKIHWIHWLVGIFCLINLYYH